MRREVVPQARLAQLGVQAADAAGAGDGLGVAERRDGAQSAGHFGQAFFNRFAVTRLHRRADLVAYRAAEARAAIGVEHLEECRIAGAHETDGEVVRVIVQTEFGEGREFDLAGENLAVHQHAVAIEDHR